MLSESFYYYIWLSIISRVEETKLCAVPRRNRLDTYLDVAIDDLQAANEPMYKVHQFICTWPPILFNT